MTTVIDPDAIVRCARDLGVPEWSDAQLVHEVAARVRVPRRDPANSFVLHAPLEVLARAALLPWVAPPDRELARLRLVSLLVQYEAAEPMVPAPEAAHSPAVSAPQLAADLADAISAQDLEGADLAAALLAREATADALPGLLGDAVLPALAAAGHASIFLHLLPRVAPRGEATAELLRPLARELARAPQLRIEWIETRADAGGSPAALAAALRDVPALGLPGSTFVYPLMHQVDEAGIGADLLAPAAAGVSPRDAGPVLTRHAARAMVLAAPEHAAYGWSHSLTMTQGAVSIAARCRHPQRAVDVAATYLTGFLAGEATEPVPNTVRLASPGGTLSEALASGRRETAGWVLDSDPARTSELWAAVVSRASRQHDAHLVKYTLACLDATAADPGAGLLYLAAAASLLAFWESVANPEDPLADLAGARAG